MTQKEKDLVSKYSKSILNDESLNFTEEKYWEYRFYIESLKEKNLPYNKSLFKSLEILRKGYLENRLK